MNTSIFRSCLLTVTLTVLTAGTALAQSASGSTTGGLALRIADLTAEERDALNREFSRTADARILFACVPAGLIIIGSPDVPRSTDSLRLRAMPGLLRNVAPNRITEDHLTLQHAEELCAEERDH